MPNSPLFLSFRTLFYYVGFWNLNPSKLYKIYSWFIIIAALFATMAFLHEIKNAEDLTEFGFSFGAFLTLVVNVSKILISKTAKFDALLTEMFKQDEYLNSVSQDDIRENYIQHTKVPLKIVSSYKMTMVGTLTLNIFISITFVLGTMGAETSVEKPLPYSFMVPFDKQENYVMTHVYLDVVAILVGIVVVAGDFLVLAPILYLNCRLKTLKFVLQHPNVFFRRDFSYDENYYEIIRKCVLEHHAIISDLREFNSITKYLILCDFLFHSSQIAAFVVSIIASETVTSFGNTFNLACGMFVLFQLFIVYWQGQILINESGTISLAIYQSCWYEADYKTRRLLIMMMLRSHKPLALTVGPFFPVNLELFLKIVKTVYSITTLFFRT